MPYETLLQVRVPKAFLEASGSPKRVSPSPKKGIRTALQGDVLIDTLSMLLVWLKQFESLLLPAGAPVLHNSPDLAVQPPAQAACDRETVPAATQPAGTEQQFDRQSLHSTADLSSLLSFTGHLMRQYTLSMPAEWQVLRAQLDSSATAVYAFLLNLS